MNKLKFLMQGEFPDNKIDYTSLTTLDLLYDVFFSDISIVINSVSFDYKNGSDVNMPILDFLWSLSYVISDINEGSNETEIEITESNLSYKFSKDGDYLIVSCNWSNTKERILYSEFKNVAMEFINQGFHFLEDKCISIMKNINYTDLKNAILSRLH